MRSLTPLNLPYDFNPRSLAGATSYRRNFGEECQFQSTLPRGSDFIQTAA